MPIGGQPIGAAPLGGAGQASVSPLTATDVDNAVSEPGQEGANQVELTFTGIEVTVSFAQAGVIEAEVVQV